MEAHAAEVIDPHEVHRVLAFERLVTAYSFRWLILVKSSRAMSAAGPGSNIVACRLSTSWT